MFALPYYANLLFFIFVILDLSADISPAAVARLLSLLFIVNNDLAT